MTRTETEQLKFDALLGIAGILLAALVATILYGIGAEQRATRPCVHKSNVVALVHKGRHINVHMSDGTQHKLVLGSEWAPYWYKKHDTSRSQKSRQ